MEQASDLERPADRPRTVDEVLADEVVLRAGDASPDALCLSGGGIRSATFGLGVIQGLAERGVLARLDYLSTVSGGGFIGGWLAAWKTRVGGIEAVVPRLRRDAPPTPPGEPDPIQHLRAYNSYMSPRGGGLSSDLWTLLATIMRNILLNWMVLIPLLLFVLMLPRLFLALLVLPEFLHGSAIYQNGLRDYAAPVLDAISGSPLVAFVVPGLGLLLFGAALFFTLRYLPGLGGRPHSRADYTRWILGPMIGAALAFLIFDSLYYLGARFTDQSEYLHIMGWVFAPCVGAWLAFLVWRSGRAPLRIRRAAPLSLAIGAMAAGTGLAMWVATNFILWHPDPGADISWATYVTIGPPVVLLGFSLATVLFVGLSSHVLADEDREWMSRAVAGALVFSLCWSVVCGLVLVVPAWALGWQAWIHGVLAAVAAASGWLTSRGSSTVVVQTGRRPSAEQPPSRWTTLAAAAAPIVFLTLLVVFLSILTNLVVAAAHTAVGATLAGPHGEPVPWTNHYGILTRSNPVVLLGVTLVFLLGSVVMSRYVNINTFSLHAMYRDRIVRAYLGASNADRRANPFTGFCDTDDMPLAAVNPRLKPLPVLNLTLNLVATSRLAWQQRRAESFTMTPLAAGSAWVGYRPSSRYAGGISLGTATALSGAAASPNMGSSSSPTIGFIMTLFNARLGAWLGNPGPQGDRTWRLTGPRSTIRSLVAEALGQTTDRSEFVYLSDGAHFENLAMYEMIRRRCRHMIVVDAGCDPDFQFSDLGNALRKIRIDFRVPIDFEGDGLQPIRDRTRRWAVARIRYSDADPGHEDGWLIYLKPLLRGTEAPDIASYASANPTFPHQSTADQWFDESQTESYRLLGLTTIDELCDGWQGEGLGSLCEHLSGTTGTTGTTGTR